MIDTVTTWTCQGCDATGHQDREAEKHTAPGHSTCCVTVPKGAK